MTHTFALVDCNSFYASCEKLFRPDLKQQPVVVLSNNDGCIVARSKEAKALGIKMGVPIFQVREQLQRHQVVVFSSNYPLYADISSRVMQTLESLCPQVEVYSIDEAFVDLSNLHNLCGLEEFGQHIRQQIDRQVGMPVCVSIAPTKTLAKLANQAAKQFPATAGVVDLSCPLRQRRLLKIMPVGDVWGVGRKLSKHLQQLGIRTALQLAEANTKVMRRHFSVVLERTIAELNGDSCLQLSEINTSKQQIICSRSFSRRVLESQSMGEAICTYTSRAAEKLREQQQYANSISIFIRTSPFSPNSPYYANSATCRLDWPSNDTRIFLQRAKQMLASIWRDGFQYAKAGVMLDDFYPPGVYQLKLFESMAEQHNSRTLMATLDHINHSGRGKVWFAGQGIQQTWSMQQNYLSPAYTTRWSDLPLVT